MLFDRISKSKVFTTVDLKNGYWQIRMHPNSIAKTAFSTGDGHYEFLKLPFGLRNAPAVFSKIMRALFGNMPFIEIYIDDITIHSKSFVKHIGHIKCVLDKIKEHKLKLNGAKCEWARSEIKLLGHIITGNSVKMDPDKISAIESWTTSTTVNHIQKLLGLCGYYRNSSDFSKIPAALYNLLKADVKWKWTP